MKSLRLFAFMLMLFCFSTVIFTTPVSVSQAAVQIDGSYNITDGRNPNGSPYKGAVAINKVNQTYSVKWSVRNSPPYQGVGLLVDNVLGVGWATGGDNGVVVYRVDGGRLSGRWAQGAGGGAVGTEELEGPANLNGTYKIVNATQPGGGGKYTGTVTIKPTGSTYAVNWVVGNERYSGIGVLQGNLLIVGWSVKAPNVGVVTYKVQGASLSGVWAVRGDTKLGTESLGR